MKLNRMRINITTDGSGDGTGYGDRVVQGTLYAVQLIDGDFADGVDVTITCEQGLISIPVLIKADFNSDSLFYPRVKMNLGSDGSALTGTAGYDLCMPLLFGMPKVVIASGGDTKTGGVILYFEE